jgi:bifunctional DNA-binding transcriptional regulator/antitoxin component of YhaV-PrlF toxin-antitoxin module
MLDKRKLLGSTKVGTDNKILFLKNAAELLDLKKGDMVTFYEENGKVYIEKGYSSEHFRDV